MEKRQLPPCLQSLPTVTADVKYELSKGRRTPSLEGSAFDRYGNFYCCHTAPDDTDILKITPQGDISCFAHTREGMTVGLAFHKDGRLFATDLLRGSVRQFSAQGELLCEAVLSDEAGRPLRCDCMVFDGDGTLLVTDLRGTMYKPDGGVWRLTPQDGYQSAQRLLGGLASPNGICLIQGGEYQPYWDGDSLIVVESNANRLVRFCLDEQHGIVTHQYSPIAIFQNFGKPNVDTCCVDKLGNIYQAIMFGGRAVVLNPEGLPVKNVVVPGFEDWKLQYTPNLLVHPDRPECYLLASDGERAVVLSFPALASGQKLFSMQ